MRIMQQILRPALRSLRRHARPVARSTRLSTPLRAVTTLPSPILSAISQFRQQSTASTPSRPLPHKPAPHRDPNEPIYQLTFTCKVCSERSSHTISKQGYHRGTILITCSGCKNRHLIADHLRIFADQSTTIEDIMRKQGEEVQRGSITPDGDVEFWAEDAEPNAKG